jgi:ATP-dependent metalloprotease
MGRAVKLLKTREDELHKVGRAWRFSVTPRASLTPSPLATALVEYETLSLDEVKLVLAGKKLDRPTDDGEKLMGEAERRHEGAVVDGI